MRYNLTNQTTHNKKKTIKIVRGLVWGARQNLTKLFFYALNGLRGQIIGQAYHVLPPSIKNNFNDRRYKAIFNSRENKVGKENDSWENESRECDS